MDCDAKQMLPVFLVCLGVLGCKPSPAQNPAPDAELVWSVTLEKNASLGSTSSDFAASRRAVFAGDRVVVMLDVGPLVFENGRPKRTNRLLSFHLYSGVVRNQQDITDYRMPDLYATDDDHVIMGEFSLTRLNSDLTSTSEAFTEKGHGRTIQISPDGSILAHETTPGTELLDSHNFLPTGIRLAESVPTAVSTDAVLTDNVHWVGQYPHDVSFVTLTDKRGQHLLYHGQCSGRPAFLTRHQGSCDRMRKTHHTRYIRPNIEKSEPSTKRRGFCRGIARWHAVCHSGFGQLLGRPSPSPF